MPKSAPQASLLQADEPPPVLELAPHGDSEFLIVVDHAGALIPRTLQGLSVSESELRRHIAWDIGALAVARGVSQALGAPLVAQNYSRLVIDCNRDPSVPSSIPLISEYTEIPGNVGLSDAARTARRLEIFEPYHARIRKLLDARSAAGKRTILVAQHSMTPQYKGSRRDMHAAILYNRDRRLAGLLLRLLRRQRDLVIADNEPYFVSDETDYTVPVHAEQRGLLHVEIEIRQDLVADESGQAAWAERIATALHDAQRELPGGA